MFKVYDLETIPFEASSTPFILTPEVPPNMIGVIVYVRYTIGTQTGTIVAKLVQMKDNSITKVLDIVTLTPSQPTIPLSEGSLNGIVAIVDPGHKVAVLTEGGTVRGKIIFGYAYGRIRR